MRRLDAEELVRWMFELDRPVRFNEIVKRFNVNPNTAQWHLRKLNDAGIVEVVETWRGRAYRLKGELATARRHFTLAACLTAVPMVMLLAGILDPLALSGWVASAALAWALFIKEHTSRLERLLSIVRART